MCFLNALCMEGMLIIMTPPEALRGNECHVGGNFRRCKFSQNFYIPLILNFRGFHFHTLPSSTVGI